MCALTGPVCNYYIDLSLLDANAPARQAQWHIELILPTTREHIALSNPLFY